MPKRMYCPNCKEEHPGKFCPECGAQLIEKPASLSLQLGDANAISGGISIDQSMHHQHIDNSTHQVYNTHNVINNVTNIAAQKTAGELLDEHKAQFAEAVKVCFEDNVLQPEEEEYLEDLRTKLELDRQTALQLIDNGRRNAAAAGRRTTLEGQAAATVHIITNSFKMNDVKRVRIHLPKLAALAKKNDVDEVQHKYYVALAALEPQELIRLHEITINDNYWREYWAYIAYHKAGMPEKAEELLTELTRFTKYPEENLTLLSTVEMLNNVGIDDAQEIFDTLTGKHSPELKLFVDALIRKFMPERAEEFGATEENTAFYTQYILSFLSPEELLERERRQAEEELLAQEEAKRKEEVAAYRLKEQRRIAEARRQQEEALLAAQRAEEERRAREAVVRRQQEEEMLERRRAEDERRAKAEEARRLAEEERRVATLRAQEEAERFEREEPIRLTKLKKKAGFWAAFATVAMFAIWGIVAYCDRFQYQYTEPGWLIMYVPLVLGILCCWMVFFSVNTADIFGKTAKLCTHLAICCAAMCIVPFFLPEDLRAENNIILWIEIPTIAISYFWTLRCMLAPLAENKKIGIMEARASSIVSVLLPIVPLLHHLNVLPEKPVIEILISCAVAFIAILVAALVINSQRRHDDNWIKNMYSSTKDHKIMLVFWIPVLLICSIFLIILVILLFKIVVIPLVKLAITVIIGIIGIIVKIGIGILGLVILWALGSASK